MMKLRKNGVTWREIDGEIILLDLESSTYLTTNRTGTVLLRLLVEDRETQELVTALVDGFSISRELAQADVSSFVQTLSEKGLMDNAPTVTDV